VESINKVTNEILGASFRIHSSIGPGLFESVYEIVLARFLEKRSLHVERQKPISFEFDGMYFDQAFKADLVVERCVIVEVKCVAGLLPLHTRQMLTYLRLMDLELSRFRGQLIV
jgi:iron complex transport system substrate-binding protein